MQIDVALVAWPNHPKRWQCCRETVASLKRYLTASSHILRYMCSSESKRDPKHGWYGDALTLLCEKEHILLRFREGAPGLGENMNAALKLCRGDFILLVQDDRPLLKPLDLSESVDYMVRNRRVDLIRYAWPMGRSRLTMHPDGWRRFDLQAPWPYGDEPHLRRREFMDRWGWYHEDVRHGAAEGIMLHHLKRGGATIVAADDVYFGHNGAHVSAVIDDVRPQGKNRRIS